MEIPDSRSSLETLSIRATTSSSPINQRFQRYISELNAGGGNFSIHDLPTPEIESLPNNCSLHEIPMPRVKEGDQPNEEAVRTREHLFSRSRLKLVRGVKQYLFDENNVEFLDCINSTAHVGHCHPQVVSAGHHQMSKLATAQGFVSDVLNKYVKELVATLPEPLSVCYLCNSGSEANDLALRLAGQATGHKDVVSAEDSYFGNLSALVHVGGKMHAKVPNYKKPDWVHIVPLPDTFRYQTDQDWEEYSRDFEESIAAIIKGGRNISAFIFESMFVIPGLHCPPASVIKSMVRSIRSRGGLIITDEVQTGMGRTGEYMWGFMNYEIVPDIVTIGKPLGNGYPLGAVICSSEISTKLGGYFSTFGGNPVSCATGLAVLEVLRNEKLMSSAKMVGKYLKAELEKLKEKHILLGDNRGLGLVQTLEIVSNARGTPAPHIATEVMYGLKLRNILVAVNGLHKNIILISPPMCFNMENSRRLVRALDEVLSALERNPANNSVIVSRNSMESVSREILKRGIIGSENESVKRQRLETAETEDGHGYEDMD